MTMKKSLRISRLLAHYTTCTSGIVLFLLVLQTCNSFSPPHAQTVSSGQQLRRQDTNAHISSSPSASSSSSVIALAISPSSIVEIDATSIAQGLGYLVGSGSLLLYTPIAIRIVRQGSADGLTLSTWWLKLIHYTCSILYSTAQGYPLSTFLETVIIAAEATTILGLVAYYQRSLDAKFLASIIIFVVTVAVVLREAPLEVLAVGQTSSALLNVVALLPQFALNAKTQTAGDYSPVTASLATVGCTIRLFTTYQLTGSDPLLLGSYGLAFVLNGSLLLQILYYGVRVEGKPFIAVMTADVSGTSIATTKET